MSGPHETDPPPPVPPTAPLPPLPPDPPGLVIAAGAAQRSIADAFDAVWQAILDLEERTMAVARGLDATAVK